MQRAPKLVVCVNPDGARTGRADGGTWLALGGQCAGQAANESQRKEAFGPERQRLWAASLVEAHCRCEFLDD